MTSAASHPSITPSNAADTLEDRMMRFLSLSQDILSLVRHENAILLEKGELSFESYIMRKVALMNDFEKEARKLLGQISGRDTKMNAQMMLIDEIRRVRDALQINSGYQLDMIRARMQEKNAAPEADGLFGEALKDEGSVCH
jgi:hypothetical protein